MPGSNRDHGYKGKWGECSLHAFGAEAYPNRGNKDSLPSRTLEQAPNLVSGAELISPGAESSKVAWCRKKDFNGVVKSTTMSVRETECTAWLRGII